MKSFNSLLLRSLLHLPFFVVRFLSVYCWFLLLGIRSARGIDYAIANNEVPGRAPDLPNLIKQVCQQENEPQLQAAIMVLMISIKLNHSNHRTSLLASNATAAASYGHCFCPSSSCHTIWSIPVNLELLERKAGKMAKTYSAPLAG
ncbi:hypothetical protein L2E82_49984 [Cichorium intybus]|nr:hypothetical protein L2E82_49984 [Cichorium intybus]